MSAFPKRLFDFIKKHIKNIKRLIKWMAFVNFSAIVIIWYKYWRQVKHDNIQTLPDWDKYWGHGKMMRRHWLDLSQHIYVIVKRAGFPKLGSISFARNYGILINDPDLLKFIFCTKFESFKKGKQVKDELFEMLGDGIFTSDPPDWKFHRKIASRMFSMRNLKAHIFECTVNHTKKVIRKINSNKSNLNDVDIYNMLARYTLDCFTSIAFGKSINSIDIYPKKHEFAEAFDELITTMALRHVSFPFLWKTIRKLPDCLIFGNESKIKKDIFIINKFADDVLDSRQTLIANISDEDGNKHNDIISLFIKYDATLTHTQLKHIAMNMIIAGRDTTRLILSWFLYEMCKPKNNDILLKIYAEIDDYILNNNTNEIEYDGISDNLLYLESTLLETLRLNPVVPFLIRTAQNDVTLPNGNIIRKDDQVVVATYSYGRNPSIYKDPLKFNPNRFYDRDQAPLNVFNVFKYPFFNVNPRLCLGRKLAMMESKVFVFYFFQQYNFEMIPDQNVKIKTGIVLNMENGLRLKLTKK